MAYEKLQHAYAECTCWPVVSKLLVNQYSVRPEGTLSEKYPASISQRLDDLVELGVSQLALCLRTLLEAEQSLRGFLYTGPDAHYFSTKKLTSYSGIDNNSRLHQRPVL